MKVGATSSGRGEQVSLEWTLERIKRAGFIAILRGQEPTELVQRGVELADAGARALEVTLDSTDASWVFQMLRGQLEEEVLMGVGTVMHAETALRSAAEWGAEFALSPIQPEGMVELAHDLGVLAVPGASTANELWNAHLSGAMLVKLYPAVTSWSPEMMAGLPDPMRQVNMLPTGGITPDDVEGWLDAGAFACGLGSSLTVQNTDILSSRMLERRGVLR